MRSPPTHRCVRVRVRVHPAFTDVNTLAFRCECELEVRLKGFADKKTYIYYGLENFYQVSNRDQTTPLCAFFC